MIGYLVIAIFSGLAACLLSVALGAGVWLAVASYVLGLWAGFAIALGATLHRRKVAAASLPSGEVPVRT
ncbi:hypothetical protein [Pontibaca salina]|uniref:Uncharacterized protein n=1 Tax=Pontibaca salina TaxID=2795731 RepID=A0A934HR20_9RHOB|nr:hypothetical protein [Pontibaca salina]MBI6630152.1 hypothetical protein [Pontibaca salina]